MTATWVWRNQGFGALLDDVLLSECPYDVGTVAHQAWTEGWIEAECERRQHAGTFGRSAEEWAEARAEVGVGRPDPCQEVTDNLAEMEAEDRLRAQVEAMRAGAVTAEDFQRAVAQLGQIGRTSAQVVDGLARAISAWFKQMEPFFEDLKVFAYSWNVDPEDRPPVIRTTPPPLPAKVCPRHGDEMRGGLCRRCARGQVRAAGRARR